MPDEEVLTAEDVGVLEVEPDPFPAAPAREGKEGELYELLWRRAATAEVKLGLGVGFRRVQLTVLEHALVQEDPRWSNLDTAKGKLAGAEHDEQHGVYLGTIGDVCFFVAPEA